MMALTSTLALLVVSHAPVPATLADAVQFPRHWLAQEGAQGEEPDPEEDDGAASEPRRVAPGRGRPVPSVGNRRLQDPATLRKLQEADREARQSASQKLRGRALDRIRRNVEQQRPGGAVPEGPDDAAESAAEPNDSPARTPAPTRTAQAEEQDSIDLEKRARSGQFSFEFSKAEIMDVVKAISNLTRRNFIIPEKIKSQRITILSPTKISAREAWSVFLAALEVNGITVVRSGKFYKLVEAKDAQKSPIPLCLSEEDNCPQYTDYMVTYLLRLEHIEAAQLNGILKSMVSRDGQVTVFAPSNALVISDYAPNIRRLRRMIDSLDVAGGNDEIQIVKIQYATASEVSETVRQVFEVDAAPAGNSRRRRTPRARAQQAAEDAAEEDEDEVSISKIVADDRTNQIVIRANQRSFEAIKQLISRIDVPVADGEQGKVHVYYLENASAEDLASTLSSLSSGASPSGQTANRRRPNNPSQPEGQETAALFEGEVQVTAEPSTNSLIIIASPRDFRALRRIIAQLDLPRRQVYVEAAILEVTVGGDIQLGTNWHAPFSENGFAQDAEGSGSIGFIQGAPGGGVSPTLTPLTDPTSLLTLTSGSLVGLIGEGISIPVGDNTLTLPGFGVVLRALQSANNAQILSTPHILTTDNEEASIEVGQRIPFRRGTAIPPIALGAGGAGGAGNLGGALGGLNNLFSATDRIDVSLKLTLTPQINELDKIRLEIDQQIEDIVGSDPATQQPITANRSAKTVVVVDDQQTVVLGGLIRDRKRETENKVPILGDLPIIGWLFKSRTNEVEKVNLVLVLTPYIIRDSSDFQRIFERKIKEYEEFAEEFYGDTAEYRAYVDYERKTGPLAMLATRVLKERALIENGGDGGGEEDIVMPERTNVEFQPLIPRDAPAAEPEPPPEIDGPSGPPPGEGEEVVVPDDVGEDDGGDE